MQIDKDCKAVIESMNMVELKAYIYFLDKVEIPRHRADIVEKLEQNRVLRNKRYTPSRYPIIKDAIEVMEFDEALVKLFQTAIYRHRKDIKETKLCIERAEKHMEELSGSSS